MSGGNPIGDRLEPLPLLAVVACVGVRVGAFAGFFQFDVAGEQLVSEDGVVGAAEAAGQLRFPLGDEFLAAKRLADGGEEVFQRCAELIFGRALRGGLELRGHVRCEGLQRLIDRLIDFGHPGGGFAVDHAMNPML